MRNFVIGCVVILAMAEPAFSEAKEPPKEIAVDLGGGVKLEMVLIPAGSFRMGDDKGYDWEKPIHRVNITKPFYLGKYEVTQEQWESIMSDNPSRIRGAKNPVKMVSWDDCQQFLVKLNAKTGEEEGKFVLPSEAQWEYASRGGSNKQFCFGDDEKQLGEYAWYDKNSESRVHSVGKKKPNAFGLYDMHGNVWEWCKDWYGKYGAELVTDPSGPATGSYRVCRGGSWSDFADLCRSASRSYPTSECRDPLLGLRVSLVSADKDK